MARRRRVVSPVSQDVPRHQPEVFSDEADFVSLDVPESDQRWRGPLLSASEPFPLLLRRPAVYLYPPKPRTGGWGQSPQAEPERRRARRSFNVARQVARQAHLHAKHAFNVLSVPFSRRTKVCVDRKRRRQVIFALRKRGVINRRSPGGAGGYRRVQSSQWRC